MNDCTHQVIFTIVEKGFAEEAMAAARKAGAGGGTIINAKGTFKDTEKFYGVELHPEKEMLMIVVPTQKRNEIMAAIAGKCGLATNGKGVSFSLPVSETFGFFEQKNNSNEDLPL